MRTSPSVPRELAAHEVIALVALAAGALSTLHAALGHLIMPHFVPLSSDVFSEPVHWGAWVAMAPVIGAVMTRFPLEAGRYVRALGAGAVLVCVSAPIVGFVTALSRFQLMLWHIGPGRADRMRWNPMVAIPVAILEALGDFVVLVGFYQAFTFHRRARERQLHASELQRHLSAARLRALQAQLQPHFLFNALNSTAMLALTDAAAARDMIVALSDLLRRALNVSGRLEVPLSEEIDFLDRYLAIERVRFGERLRVTFDVDEDALAVPVPSLILQPLVENAVRHGIARMSGVGEIVVRARASTGNLELVVEDDGPGAPTGWNPDDGGGVGIANVRDRLRQAYGDEQSMTFDRRGGRGFIVRICCPRGVVEVAAIAEVAAS